MDFSDALKSLKEGKRVTRQGWNGKGMYLYFVSGSTLKVAKGRPLAAHLPVGEEVTYRPHIDLKDAQGNYGMWCPITNDVLADDWECLD